jgi:hypothetical protein
MSSVLHISVPSIASLASQCKVPAVHCSVWPTLNYWVTKISVCLTILIAFYSVKFHSSFWMSTMLSTMCDKLTYSADGLFWAQQFNAFCFSLCLTKTQNHFDSEELQSFCKKVWREINPSYMIVLRETADVTYLKAMQLNGPEQPGLVFTRLLLFKRGCELCTYSASFHYSYVCVCT